MSKPLFGRLESQGYTVHVLHHIGQRTTCRASHPERGTLFAGRVGKVSAQGDSPAAVLSILRELTAPQRQRLTWEAGLACIERKLLTAFVLFNNLDHQRPYTRAELRRIVAQNREANKTRFREVLVAAGIPL